MTFFKYSVTTHMASFNVASGTYSSYVLVVISRALIRIRFNFAVRMFYMYISSCIASQGKIMLGFFSFGYVKIDRRLKVLPD